MLSKLEPHRVLLLKAADVIRERGHCQDNMLDYRTGAVCLMGALNIAAFGTEWGIGWGSNPAYDEAYRTLRSYVGRPIVEYNDQFCNKAETAIATLENAALAHTVPV